MNRNGEVRIVALLALVSIGVSCHDPDEYLLGPTRVGGGRGTATDSGDGDMVLRVRVEPRSLPADGVSSATITATIAPRSDVLEVVFDTTAGELVGGTGTEDSRTKQTVPVDTAKRAVAELISDIAPAVAVVTVTVTRTDQVASVVQRIGVRFVSVE